MNLDCRHALPLVPLFVDGELSEAQASPLRHHLMECPSCRSVASEEKALKRWFTPAAEEAGDVVVPLGFASRLARRAFAGDSGSDAHEELIPAAPPAPTPAAAFRGEDRILQFVLQITAVAAIFLITLSIAIRSVNVPSSTGLRADDRQERTLDQVLDDLDLLNREEAEDDGREAELAPGLDPELDPELAPTGSGAGGASNR